MSEQATPASAIEPWLREILRCPACRSELRDDTGPTGGPELVCTSGECGLAYRIDNGVPVLQAFRPPDGWPPEESYTFLMEELVRRYPRGAIDLAKALRVAKEKRGVVTIIAP